MPSQNGNGCLTSHENDFCPSEPKLDALHWHTCLGCWEQRPLDRKSLCCFSSAQCKRLEGGLDKLKEATIQLDELNQKLAEQKIVLAEKSAACEALLEEIATNTAIGECRASSGGGDPPKKDRASLGDIPGKPLVRTGLFVCFVYVRSMYNFLGQGLNPSHSSDNVRSLTH